MDDAKMEERIEKPKGPMSFHVIKPEGRPSQVKGRLETLLSSGNSCYMDSSHSGERFPEKFRVSK